MNMAPAGSFERPVVSVLIPAWNEADMLSRCLDSILATKSPHLEVIVSAGGSDGTLAIANQYSKRCPNRVVSLEQSDGEGKQSALRRCYAVSRGDVIFLTDADCVVPNDTLSRLVAYVSSGSADAATGMTVPLQEQRCKPWVRHQWATSHAIDRMRGRDSTGLHGRVSAVRREAIESAGAFADDVRTGTDYHLAKKLLAAGRSIHFLPVAVETRFETDLRRRTAQQSRWMRNILVHGRRFGDTAEVASVTKTMALGPGLLLFPLTWKWTRLPGMAVWTAAIGWMASVRLRQNRQLDRDEDLEPTQRPVAEAVLFSLADLLAWSRPVLDLMSGGRERW
jgi:poly-beta-1,6-N-acetyl-D-glucosamine synthase